MGLDPDEMAGAYGNDPELAALEREIRRKDKKSCLEATNDQDLLAELEGYGQEDPYEHVSSLRERIIAEQNEAVRFNKAGDKKSALTHLRQKKALDKELAEYLEIHPEAGEESKEPVK